MSKEKIKNIVINLKLLWFELQIKTQGKYYLPFFQSFNHLLDAVKLF